MVVRTRSCGRNGRAERSLRPSAHAVRLPAWPILVAVGFAASTVRLPGCPAPAHCRLTRFLRRHLACPALLAVGFPAYSGWAKDAATRRRLFGSVVWRLSRNFGVVAGQGECFPRTIVTVHGKCPLGQRPFALGRTAAGCGLPWSQGKPQRRAARATRTSGLLSQSPRTYQRARQPVTVHGVAAVQSGVSPCLLGKPPSTDPAKRPPGMGKPATNPSW